MFRLTQEPSSGSYNQCLTKLQVLFNSALSLTTYAPTSTVEQDL